MAIKRIMIFGRPGSGKTTFALKLSQCLHLPLHHLDKYSWQADWVERPFNEFMMMQEDLVKQNSWIIDGNHPWTFQMRYSRADIAIYFDYPRYLCLMRLLKRYFFKDHSIQDRAEGCPERINKMILRYMWNFQKYVNTYIPPLRKRYPKVSYYIVQNDAQAKELLRQLCKH